MPSKFVTVPLLLRQHYDKLNPYRYKGPKSWSEAFEFEWFDPNTEDTYVFPDSDFPISIACQLGFKLYRSSKSVSDFDTYDGYWLRQADYEVTIEFIKGLL